MRIIDAGFASGLFYRGENVFGADVADKIVSGEGAAAEAGKRAIEAPTSGLVGGENFGFGCFRVAVEMRAEFDSCDVLVRTLENIGNNFWSGVASSVGERNGFDANVFQPFESFFDEFGAPGFVIGISEGHGNVDDEAAPYGLSFFV